MVNNSVEDCIYELASSLRQDVELGTVTNNLQKLTILMRSSKTRCDLKSDHWEIISKLAASGLHILSKNAPTSEELDLLAEFCRFLRNSCGGSFDNQYFILNNATIFNCSTQFLKCFLHKESPKELLILKICIQLFGNILVCNEDSKPVVWNLFFEGNKFKSLFESKDDSIQECTMMVLFNCMSEENSKYIFDTKEGHDVLIAVTDSLLNNQNDWGMLFIEYLLKQEGFLKCSYGVLPLKNRLFVLDIMVEKLKNAQDDGDFSIPTTCIENIKNLFLKHITVLSNLEDLELEPAETMSLLSILCSASICDAYISLLQRSKDLLQINVETLKCIHLLGKEGNTVFSSLSDFNHMSSQFSEEIRCHPFYGFKKNLIRLIGNLCYNCKENQDLVRKLDGIPLVLDCCKFDAKNPYITQWCILAIRNLLENNPENQAIIAGISVSGDVVDSKFLKEMGFDVQKEDGNFRIRSTSSSAS